LNFLTTAIVSAFIIAAAPPPLHGQTQNDLKIRILNARNGKALKNVRASLGWLNGPISPVQKTNGDGVVVFRLPDALPRTLVPFVDSFELTICSDNIRPIDQILATGEVSENNCGKAKYGRAAEPGELTIFARHLNLFQRIYKLYY
jgi:hypothetical protein